jgi:hypothetical protein
MVKDISQEDYDRVYGLTDIEEAYSMATTQLNEAEEDGVKGLRKEKDLLEEVRKGINIKFHIRYWIEKDKYWITKIKSHAMKMRGESQIFATTDIWDEIDARKAKASSLMLSIFKKYEGMKTKSTRGMD